VTDNENELKGCLLQHVVSLLLADLDNNNIDFFA